MLYYPGLFLCRMRRAFPILALLLGSVALAQSPSGDSAYAHALGAYETGDWQTAEALLADVLGRDRRNAEAHHLLALVYAGDGPQHDARRARSHAEQALETSPDNPRYLETRLRQYQRDLSEERAFSMTDGRRATLARRILALDSTSALAHEERALAYFLEFDWRRGLANQRGGWNQTAERGMSGAANRALGRMQGHLDAALASEPGRASAYRLLLRAAATARNDAGLFDAAQRMKNARPDDPDATLFLGLGLYRNGLLAAAETQFAEALAGMPDDQRRRFQDVARLVHKDTVIEGDTAAFAARFWRARDPRLLTAQNERRLEHYARLALTDLLFTDAFRERRGWETVRGEVAVRYGLPLAEASRLSLRDGRFTRWVYDDFSLLFQDTFVSGDPDFWSSAEGEDEATRARSLMTREPERFDYAPPSRLAFPFVVTTFRSDDGGADVYVHLGVPVAPDEAPTSVRAGAFLIGDDFTVAAEARNERGRVTSADAPYGSETFVLHAAPGAYELAVEFEKGRGGLGFERVPLTVPSYAPGTFAMSDMLLARGVEEVEGAAAGLVRRGFQIAPAPSRTFPPGQPVYVYIEGYGLRTVAGRSRYALAVTLTPEDTATELAGLARRFFGARERGVGVEFEGEASGADFGEYVVLDASAQPPGPYLLTLRLRDLVSGEALERTTSVFIE